MKLVILGPPGAGKGTLAPTISKLTDVKHVSTGNMFRDNIKNRTELGLQAKAYMSDGQLVPDSLTIDMVRETIVGELNSEGFLLDGFPRTVEQAEALDAMLAGSGKELDAVICLAVDDNIIIDRLSSRMVCDNCGAIYNSRTQKPKVEGVCDVCGSHLSVRDDDQPATVKKRLKSYHEETEGLLAYYQRQNKIIAIDGSRSADETEQKVREVIANMVEE